jgi:recombination protein RecA
VAELDKVMDDLNKRYGSGSIMWMNDKNIEPVKVFSTGVLTLDRALGVWGLPRGRLVEIYGAESTGKTTLCLQTVAQAQKYGGQCAFIDTEHSLDFQYAANLGVDVDKIIISQPDYGEQALEITEALIASGKVDIVVVDSIAALTPKAEIEGDMGDSHMGLQARMMSQALRKLNGITHKTDTLVIFTNQLRSKIGVMFGSPNVTTGGNAMKYYASVRLDLSRIEQIKVGTDVVGAKIRCKVAKNKMAPPHRIAEYDIMFGEGISNEACVLDLGVEFGVIKKAGAWFADPETGESLGQGRDNAKQFLKEHPEYVASLIEQMQERGL